MQMSIIELSVENFKIFKEKAVFSMVADRKSEHTFESNGESLLKTSMIYGPNASGKSSLFEGFRMIKDAVLNSSRRPEKSKVLLYKPFLLSDRDDQPVFYEIVFSLENRIFRFNFSMLDDEIISENLSEILLSGKENKILKREKGKISLFGDFKGSEDVARKTRKEALFLSAAAQWNNELAMKIENGFKNVNFVKGQDANGLGGYTVNLLKENGNKEKILNFLKKADFSITDVEVRKVPMPEDFRRQIMAINDKANIPESVDAVFSLHDKFSTDKKQIGTKEFNFGNESDGTQRFFSLLGPIIDTLENGRVLFIDEFDNSLHPLLTKFIVDLFEKKNPKNAQLMATTHDTSLLSYRKDFGKDHFWFTEKDKYGAGSLFSLAEFKLRNDTEYAKKYLEGRFGALPFIESVENI